MFGNSHQVEVHTPTSLDLAERNDTLASPRVSPVPWLGQGGAANSVPELVVTSAKDPLLGIHFILHPLYV